MTIDPGEGAERAVADGPGLVNRLRWAVNGLMIDLSDGLTASPGAVL
ncbi:hypothetical protein [Streptomyces sp. CBMA156]|nr:hypothetical protein [Streptomyces sp. CBMA156]